MLTRSGWWRNNVQPLPLLKQSPLKYLCTPQYQSVVARDCRP